MKWWTFNIALPLAILLVGVGVLWAFGEKSAPTKPALDQSLEARLARIPAVQTLPVRSLDAAGGRLNLTVDGVVVPYREVQIATEVSGRIIYKDAACEVGSYVQEGQLLVRIDPTDYQNEIDRLTKQKAQEYQAIRELDQEMVNTTRLIEVAKKEVELQDREIQRLRSLPAGFTSQSEVDQAERARLQSINSRITLRNQLDLMRHRRARLESAEELVGIELQMAETNLARTEIRSPISGVIYREDAELDSFVQRGAVIVTIEDTSKAEVVVNLRTDQLFWVLDQRRDGAQSSSSGATTAASYVLPSTPVEILYQVAGREDAVYRWEGRLERYDGIGVDTTSRTVPVRVVVDDPQRYDVRSPTAEPSVANSGPPALVRGMFVTAVLRIDPRRPLVVLPAVALKPGNRIWKFVPDRSVLAESAPAELPTADPQSAAAAEANRAADEAAKANPEQWADPERWVVGRLEVIANVRPIESTSLEHGESIDSDSERDDNGGASHWICEVADGQLRPGDRVITSPLPSFGGKGTDVVRFNKEQLEPQKTPSDQDDELHP